MVLTLDSLWLQRLASYECLYIGYSGGLDSSVLLTYLARCPQLQAKIRAVHVHHGISPNADQWALHCEQYCDALHIPFILRRVNVAPGANLEERARMARYQIFEYLLQAHDAVLVAHHQTDQSETVLLNLLRGAGVEGLSAMPEQRPCGAGTLLRPLLSYPRETIQAYATAEELPWIEDETNTSNHWSRSYLRHQVMPLLRAKWPAAEAMLATCAVHCRQAALNLNALAILDCDDIDAMALQVTPAVLTDRNRLHNLLRTWIKHHTGTVPSTVVLQCVIKELIQAQPAAMPIVQISATWCIRRYRQTLYLSSADRKDELLMSCVWSDFPQPLALSASVTVFATPQPKGVSIPSKSKVEIRSRRGGESILWHGQTKSLKTLFQEWGVPPWQRQQIPLLFVNDQLMAVIGYASVDSDSEEGYTISIQKTAS